MPLPLELAATSEKGLPVDITALMHRPVCTVAPETPLCQAQRLMRHHGMCHLPVLQDAAPVGLLSERQLWRAAPSPVPALARYEWTKELKHLRVQDVMSIELCLLPAHTSAPEALQVLAVDATCCLLVVDAGRLVGMVTMADIMAALCSQLEMQGPVRYEQILVAADSRATSAPVLRTALALARQHRARLTVLQVLPCLATAIPIDLDHGSPEMITYYYEERQATALEQLTACVPTDHDVPVEVQVIAGEPWVGVVRTGAKLAADLIVIGGRQRRRGTMMSHQANMVVGYAPCPVLVVEE